MDENGDPLHSWRVLILPFLGEESLYDSIDLSKPWDHPVNAAARGATVPAYRCPGLDHSPEMTTYLAVVGEDCVFNTSAPRTLDEITDGTSKTIAIVEASRDRAVHWMSPRDINADEVLSFSVDSAMSHGDAMMAVFLDVHTRHFSLDQESKKQIRAMLTISGGEEDYDSVGILRPEY